jgi:hypothetical protein
LSGSANPTGTILFRLYGPNDATCSGAIIFTSTIPVAGNGTYGSGTFTPTLAGAYRWIANYSGDANNTATANACNAANENVIVGPAAPTVVTTASAGVPLGGAIADSAVLSGGFNPTGTITFNLYGPNNATCTGTPIFTSTVAVVGNGTYGSATLTPVVVGTYRWIANYSGDVNNAATAITCNAANESVVVGQTAPTVITNASASVPLGGAISDSAVLSGGANPTGTITFRLFGPNGSYISTPAFAPTAAGTYRWIANYGGDANNTATTNACNGANESAVAVPAGPNVVTNASPSIALGGPINDAATLAGAVNPTGTIIFRLYGPDDAMCAGAVIFTSTVTVNGNGTYSSASFTPLAIGAYRWIANYSGDVNNVATANTCNADNENVVVTAPMVITDVPTLSDAALVLLTMLLGMSGLLRSPQRRGRH